MITDPPSHSTYRRFTHRHRLFPQLRFSAIELLIAQIALFVVTPFMDNVPNGQVVEGVLLSAVLVLAILTVRGGTRTLATGVVLVVLSLIGKWVNHFRPDLVSTPMFLVPMAVFVALIVVLLMHFILDAPVVDRAVLAAGLANFLMIGLFWAFCYMLVDEFEPGSFALDSGANAMEGFDALYFSFVTLSTVGYGDIKPVTDVARMLSLLEAVVGPLYVAVMIARLVALHIAKDPPATTGTD